MNLDTLFEDLESQLVDVNHCREKQAILAKCNRVHLQIEGEDLRLIAPILGADFVAGFHERRAAWMCIGMPKASVMSFSIDEKSKMPRLRKRSVKFENFIAELHPPFSAQFKPSGRDSFAGVLVATENSTVYLTETSRAAAAKAVTAIDLAALDWLAVLEDKDSKDVGDWRGR